MAKKFVEPVAIDASYPTSLGTQLAQWRTSGFALVDGLLSRGTIEEARREVMNLVESNPDLVKDDFGGFGFPFQDSVLNNVVLNPNILSLGYFPSVY